MKPVIILPVLLVACTDVTNPHELNTEEVITTVELRFAAGDESSVARWSDPENDGSPVIEPVELLADTLYSLQVTFLNDLAQPVEDITVEIFDESDQHQVFYTGDAVTSGLLTVLVDDADANGLALGLSAEVLTGSAGAGEFVVTLRHLPEQGGQPTKTAGLADQVASDGLSSIAGETDVQVSFPVEVL